MTQTSLLNQDWPDTVERLGGSVALKESARKTKAFLRGREFEDAIDMLRMILAYCLGGGGLRSTAAWAASIGLADVANTALLYRLRQSGDWLAWLVGQALSAAAPKASQGRPIRIVDATNVLKAGAAAKTKNQVWRIHSAFDLPCERFGFFELTDEHGGEQLDRAPVIKGEIRLGDRVYMQPDRIAALLEAGADIVVRSGWRMRVGSMPMALRLICSPSLRKQRRADGSTAPFGSAASPVQRWLCVLSRSKSRRRPPKRLAARRSDPPRRRETPSRKERSPQLIG